jgi:hypothetical protein
VIRTEARELLGDLVVQTEEVTQRRGDPERWLRLAAQAAHVEPDAELVAQLDTTLDDATVRVHLTFGQQFANSIAWERACVYRSGFEALRTLLPGRAALDTSRIELVMLRHGPKRFSANPIPDGTPRHHWWWFEAQPESERTLVMNVRMTQLLTMPVDSVPERFRRLVNGGFENDAGHVYLRNLVAENIPGAMVHARARNRIQIEKYLEPDLSRRPVDLAGELLACVRYLASELRRHEQPRCRIAVEQRGLIATFYYGRIRHDVDLASFDAAVLAMDAP